MEDMCYKRRRAETCVDQSAHHALLCERRRGRRRGTREGAVHWGGVCVWEGDSCVL